MTKSPLLSETRNRPIIIILDDVDRLSVPEVREIFKLVRLTANFPNLIYIINCDRFRVEQALAEEMPNQSGRDYLEKIIQWSYDLPEVPIHLLSQQLHEAMDNVLANIESAEPLDEQVWPEVHEDIIRPLIRNMRDVRRFAIAMRETVGGLKGQVALADVLALEAIRLFLPDVFRRLPGAIDGLTVTSQAVEKRVDRLMQENPLASVSELNKWLKSQIDDLLAATERGREPEVARTARAVVRAMLDHLFPVGAALRQSGDGDSEPHVNEDAAEHLMERRVAHDRVFRLYLERVIGPELADFP